MLTLLLGVVNCVSFNDEGTVVLSGSTDNTIKAWDCRSRGDKPIQVLSAGAAQMLTA